MTDERELYSWACNFCHITFPNLLRDHAGSGRFQVYAEDISYRVDEVGGRWTQPDIAAFAISRGTYVPYLRADLHTFEVKTASGLDVTGAHEARAQARFGQYAWLAFQAVGRAHRGGERFRQVISAAADLGIGVVTFSVPNNADDWKVDVWPHRTNTDPAVSDAFVRTRMGDANRTQIAEYLESLGWKVGLA